MATTSAGGEASVRRAGVGTRRWSGSEAWTVGLITLLALALRAACLNQSLFGDELFAYEIVHNRSLGQVFSVVHETEKTPPLGFVLSWLPERLGGPELIRLPSFVAGIATVPLLYLLGRRIFDRPTALVAALWFAMSPFQIFYGTETRSYALVAALVVLSTLALLSALEERRLRWWALYTIAATAAAYTHYIAVLTLIPQAAWALWSYREGNARAADRQWSCRSRISPLAAVLPRSVRPQLDRGRVPEHCGPADGIASGGDQRQGARGTPVCFSRGSTRAAIPGGVRRGAAVFRVGGPSML